MPDYSKGTIYKLICNNTGLIYVGSTCQPLHQRLAGHVSNFKTSKNISSCQIIANGNYSIILIEEYPCENKQQLLRKEREYIDSLECINKYRPITTIEEKNEENKDNYKQYYNTNKETILEKAKENYNTNKKTILEKAKEYYNTNKETILEKAKENYNNNKETIKDKIKDNYKQYYNTNKDKIKEQKKEYYQNNKDNDDIKEKRKLKIPCSICIKEIRKDCLTRHMKLKHKPDFTLIQ